MNKSSKDLIERIGVALERAEFQPATGRVLGYLMVSEPPRKTFEEIQNGLNMSKSAVSTALNTLQLKNLVKYSTKPGDRKRYFQADYNGWYSLIKEKFTNVLYIDKMFSSTLTQRSGKDIESDNDIQEIIDFLLFIQNEMKSAIAKWEQKRE